MSETEKRLNQRINMAKGLGRLTGGVNEASATPTIQVVFSGNEIRDNLPFLQHYGFISKPLPGSDILASFQAGDRNRGVAIACNDQRYRPKDLKDGEVAIFHHSGSRILLKNDGSIEMIPSNKQCVLKGNLQVKGNVEVEANIDVQGNINAIGDINALADVTTGEVSLKNHIHSKGYQNKPTGKPE